MTAGAGNPASTTNGPTTAAQTITFQNNTDNPTANTFAAYSPALTATYSFTNQVFSSPNAGLTFGGGGTTTSNTLTSTAIFPTMNSISGPSNSNFSSVYNNASNTGIDIAVNRGVYILTSSKPLFATNVATNTRTQMGELTVTFNTPVTNPLLHIVGLGGTYSSTTILGLTTELELQTPGVTLTKISGSSELVISGGTKILNGDATPAAATGAGAATGTIQVNGSGITSLKFLIFLEGDGGFSTWGATNTNVGDAWIMAYSLPNQVPAAPINISASSSSICSGQSSTLSATCAAGTLTWYSDAALTTTLASTTVSPITNTTYYASCVNGACKSLASNVLVSVTPTPLAASSATASPSSICSGQSSTLSASCATGTLTWYSDAALTTILASTTVSPNTTTNYYVACVNGVCKSPSTIVTVAVTQTPLAPTSASASPSTICAGASSTLTATCATGTLTWYSNAALTTIVSSPVSPATTTTYYASCVNAGCKSPSSAITVTVNPIPLAPTITPTAFTVCAGNSTTLSAIGCSGTVNWFIQGSTTVVGTGASYSPSPTVNTIYEAKCIIGTCTSSPSATATITVVPIPTSPSISVSKAAICTGQPVTLTGSTCASPAVLSWFKNGSAVAFATGLSVSDSPTASTSYSANCSTTGGAVSCAVPSTSTLNVTVNPLPGTPSITPSTSNICSGTSTTLTATGCVLPETYSWSNGQTGASISVSPAATTSYTVKCVNATTGCDGLNSTASAVTVTTTPSNPTGLSASPSNICSGTPSTLSATCAIGTLTWYSDAALTIGVTSPVSPTATTTYYASCVNGVCKSPSASIVVTVTPIPSSPTVASASPSSICSGQSATLTHIAGISL
jgi:Ig-like domain CHU_C associated